MSSTIIQCEFGHRDSKGQRMSGIKWLGLLNILVAESLASREDSHTAGGGSWRTVNRRAVRMAVRAGDFGDEAVRSQGA